MNTTPESKPQESAVSYTTIKVSMRGGATFSFGCPTDRVEEILTDLTKPREHPSGFVILPIKGSSTYYIRTEEITLIEQMAEGQTDPAALRGLFPFAPW